jgi:hypothetical protein
MRGTMLWFNSDEDHGVIEAGDERFRVRGADFTPGSVLAPRCRGTAVEFHVLEGEDARAASVTLVTDEAPRRARRRSRGR